MLQSHGLLSESGRQSPRDQEMSERERKERKRKEEEKERQRQKELKKAEAKGKDKGKSRNGRFDHAASSSESSTGSVVNDMRPALVNAPAGPSHSTRASIDHSMVTLGAGSSSQTVVWSGPRRLSYEDSYENDPDDDDDVLFGIKRRPPHRTPHGEVFSTLPAEALEQLGKPEPTSYSIFGWSKSKHNTLLHRHLLESFNPPWPVAQARYNPDKKGIVEDLNSSFQDVGLLPAVDEVKSSSSSHKRKRQPGDAKQQSKSRDEQPNVFHSFSSDYLYMLLPLWPGETDPHSAQKYPHPAPNIPVESRQYLLVFYKPDSDPTIDDSDKSRNQRDKKRSRNSPASSRDSSQRLENRPILLDKFHFCARIVTYTDIQGSGIRSPDVGLSVLGPLSEACETMPTKAYVDTFQVIGLCTSRERGIEFVPEGLEKLGLARRVADPTATIVDKDSAKRFSITGVEEPDDTLDTMLVLTPIGRAVVEMAWLGAMALTSFGSMP
ncbi:hypothetical protein EST38_g285 [Candolleomyces aberdarensis]|uniref:Uncharacterized protein n=1 Tax=Candolleomyces aberdarensis TaxID=2316362 RepID=A0A4V1Q5H8_9AGAR|nr:hypothetical protein EST38_g285 [Candolleomyces aberdarensis]